MNTAVGCAVLFIAVFFSWLAISGAYWTGYSKGFDKALRMTEYERNQK